MFFFFCRLRLHPTARTHHPPPTSHTRARVRALSVCLCVSECRCASVPLSVCVGVSLSPCPCPLSTTQHRARAVSQLKSQPATYGGFAVGESFAEYLDRMALPSTWGDNLSLQAISYTFEMEIHVLTTYDTQSLITVTPMVCVPPPSDTPTLSFGCYFVAGLIFRKTSFVCAVDGSALGRTLLWSRRQHAPTPFPLSCGRTYTSDTCTVASTSTSPRR